MARIFDAVSVKICRKDVRKKILNRLLCIKTESEYAVRLKKRAVYQKNENSPKNML